MKTSLAVLFATLLAACGGAGAHTGGTAPQRRDPNMISAEELQTTAGQTLYEAVRTLRPAWMMRRQPTALTPQNEDELLVYVDGNRFGNLESLRQLNTTQIRSVRYYRPVDAEARFGPGHLQGAIEVITAGR